MSAGLGPMGAMKNAFQTLGGAIATAMAPLIAAAPVLTTVLAILGAAGYTAHVARENWGDNRTADQLVEEGRKGRAAAGKPNGWAAPNASDAQARATTASWMGQLNIAGAPPGSTLTQRNAGAGAMSMHMLGVNP